MAFFGDISSNLVLGAKQGVRMNATGTFFEPVNMEGLSILGTTAANQLTIWNDTSSLRGDSSLTYTSIGNSNLLEVSAGRIIVQYGGYGMYTSRYQSSFTQNAYFNGAWKSYGSVSEYGPAIVLNTVGSKVGMKTAFQILVDDTVSSANDSLSFYTAYKMDTSGNTNFYGDIYTDRDIVINNGADSMGYKLYVGGNAAISENLFIGPILGLTKLSDDALGTEINGFKYTNINTYPNPNDSLFKISGSFLDTNFEYDASTYIEFKVIDPTATSKDTQIYFARMEAGVSTIYTLDQLIGGGGGSFATLTDGSIVNPLTNQTLKYDTSWGKWMNKQDFWDLSTNGSSVYLYDSSNNLELSYIELQENGGTLLFTDMPISATTVGTEQSYAMKIDGSAAFRIFGISASTALSETAVVIDANYLSLGDPQTNGSWRFKIDSSGNLSVQKRVSGSWVEKGNFN